jgi:hypothetical protein
VSSPVVAAFEHAREQTLVAGSARIELLVERAWEMPVMPYRRRGGLLRPILSAGKSGAKRLVKVAARDLDFRHQTSEGIIDITGRRYMLDYGSYARLYADGQEWDGRSGRALATLPPDASAVPTPLWLLDLLAGVVGASETGTDEVRGVTCRHLAGTADLSRASQAAPGGIAAPGRTRFEDLLALPVEVWIDDTQIRRIRFSSSEGAEQRSDTLELWDFGVPLDDLDWTRLPTFRSPDEAARQS